MRKTISCIILLAAVLAISSMYRLVRNTHPVISVNTPSLAADSVKTAANQTTPTMLTTDTVQTPGTAAGIATDTTKAPTLSLTAAPLSTIYALDVSATIKADPTTELTPTPSPAPTPTPKKTTPAPTRSSNPTPTSTKHTTQPTSSTAPTATPGGDPISSMEQQMITLVNGERANVGLAALTLDTTMRAGARKHSIDMDQYDYFSHVSPTYGDAGARIRASGISFTSAAENIAMATTLQRAHDALMASAGHRENTLNPNFGRIGIGIVWDESRHYYVFTQWFAN